MFAALRVESNVAKTSSKLSETANPADSVRVQWLSAINWRKRQLPSPRDRCALILNSTPVRTVFARPDTDISRQFLKSRERYCKCTEAVKCPISLG